MTTKERTHIMDELGDPDAPPGSRLWSLWVSNQIRVSLYDAAQSGARLRRMVEAFKEYQGWQELGFLTWDEFCWQRLQSRSGELEVTISLREETQKRAEQTTVLSRRGEIGNGRVDNYKVYNAEGGTSATYLTARIARDRPDILEDMKRGKYRSVRQAAIEAGIVDPDKSRRHQLPTEPDAAGRYLAQRVDRAWFESLIDAYYKAIEQ